MDSARFAKFTADINEGDGKPAQPMTRQEFKKYMDSTVNVFTGSGFSTRFTSLKEFDSLQHTNAREHNWFTRAFTRKKLELNEKYHNNKIEIFNAIKGALIHSLPQMLWISLPLLALILEIFYIRRRKQFYYVGHVIFSIHLYIFLFIAQLVLFSIIKLKGSIHWGILGYLLNILILGLFVYEYMALKNFYRQGWVKTFFKFLLINISYIIMLVLLFAFFGVFSFFNI